MTSPLLCATVTGETTEELRARRDGAIGADLVELRLDYVRQPDVAGALADRCVPVIVTCRPTWEGGRFSGSEEERRGLLRRALELGAEYVDVEWRARFDDLVQERQGRHIVLSMHDFNCLPGDLEEQYGAMRATGAEVVKVAVSVDSLSDTFRLAALGRQSVGQRGRQGERGELRVLVAMGAAGMVSRILAGRFGSYWTYAGEGVAPGQISLSRMRDEFRFHTISTTTDIYGVLGSPVSHSLSPPMHNAGFAALGLDAVYVPLEARDVDDFTRFTDTVPVRGASVTAPFKERVTARVAALDEVGRRVGAVNTIRLDANGWCGINTDVSGFLDSLDGRITLDGTRVAVLGAGGAARAVAMALASQGAAVTVCARNRLKAAAVASLVGGAAGVLPPVPGSWDMLVNTTPIGTYPDIDVSPMPPGVFDGRLVYDLVYNPPTTRLMADAEAAGCETIGGLEMLVAQAVRQFEWWTGHRPPIRLFKEAAERGRTWLTPDAKTLASRLK